MIARRALAVLAVVALTTTACSDDDSSAVNAGSVLETVADTAVIPAYEDLNGALDGLGDDIDAYCTAPDPGTLEVARDGWREVAVAWRRTRTVGVGPAVERRLNATVGFMARPDAIDDLLAGSEPVDLTGLRAAGAGVKGVAALEIALFDDATTPSPTPDLPRRCEYLLSVTAIAREAAGDVLDDWTGGYRETFVDGMDGDPQSSIDAIVNEAIFRVTETDDQGLRALTEAASPDELLTSRADGPAAFHLAELTATLSGVVDLLGPAREGGRPGLFELIEARSADLATRVDRALQSAEAAMEDLPDSVTVAFATPEVVIAAQEAVAALKVLLSTEVASQLGVTISFSDADGDS